MAAAIETTSTPIPCDNELIPNLIDAWKQEGIKLRVWNRKTEKFVVGELYQNDESAGIYYYLVTKDYAIHSLGCYDNCLNYSNDACAQLVGDGLILIDADGGSDLDDNYAGGFVAISFGCIEQLGLKLKDIEYVDGCGEEIIPYKGDKDLAKNHINDRAKHPLRAPKRGFTLIDRLDSDYGESVYVWHKSGHHVLSSNGKYYLLGQDEGQYFGVELPKKVKSLEEAFRSLVPVGAEKAQRQGEWFIVPCQKPKDCVSFEALIYGNCLALPKDDPDGNNHCLACTEFAVKDNIVYAYDGSLTHDQHEQRSFSGWVKFLKNLAVRSVSVDGVD